MQCQASRLGPSGMQRAVAPSRAAPHRKCVTSTGGRERGKERAGGRARGRGWAGRVRERRHNNNAVRIGLASAPLFLSLAPLARLFGFNPDCGIIPHTGRREVLDAAWSACIHLLGQELRACQRNHPTGSKMSAGAVPEAHLSFQFAGFRPQLEVSGEGCEQDSPSRSTLLFHPQHGGVRAGGGRPDGYVRALSGAVTRGDANQPSYQITPQMIILTSLSLQRAAQHCTVR